MKPLGHGHALAFEWWQMYLNGRGQPFLAVGSARVRACVYELIGRKKSFFSAFLRPESKLTSESKHIVIIFKPFFQQIEIDTG